MMPIGLSDPRDHDAYATTRPLQLRRCAPVVTGAMESQRTDWPRYWGTCYVS